MLTVTASRSWRSAKFELHDLRLVRLADDCAVAVGDRDVHVVDDVRLERTEELVVDVEELLELLGLPRCVRDGETDVLRAVARLVFHRP
jgi:hypothetical protein